MKQITIAYKSHFRKQEIIRDVPEKWNELTASQFLLIARLYRESITDPEFFKAFLDLPDKLGRLDSFYMYKLSEIFNFISDCRVPIDRFFLDVIPGTKLLAPGSRLKGMTLEQFMHVDTYFNRYLQTEKDEQLDMFVTHLYLQNNECFVLSTLPENGLFSFRKKMRKLEPGKRIKELAGIEKTVKYAVFLNFIMIKCWLSKSFKFLFPQAEEIKVSDNKRKVNVPSVNWLDIFDSFIGDDVAVMEKYQAMPATTAFRIMNKRIRETQKKK